MNTPPLLCLLSFWELCRRVTIVYNVFNLSVNDVDLGSTIQCTLPFRSGPNEWHLCALELVVAAVAMFPPVHDRVEGGEEYRSSNARKYRGYEHERPRRVCGPLDAI